MLRKLSPNQLLPQMLHTHGFEKLLPITVPIPMAKPEEEGGFLAIIPRVCDGLTILYHSYHFEQCKRPN